MLCAIDSRCAARYQSTVDPGPCEGPGCLLRKRSTASSATDEKPSTAIFFLLASLALALGSSARTFCSSVSTQPCHLNTAPVPTMITIDLIFPTTSPYYNSRSVLQERVGFQHRHVRPRPDENVMWGRRV